MTQEFVKHGIWVRPFNNLIYIMPAYIMEEKDLIKIILTMKEIISES